jgi:hypothetical protein
MFACITMQPVCSFQIWKQLIDFNKTCSEHYESGRSLHHDLMDGRRSYMGRWLKTAMKHVVAVQCSAAQHSTEMGTASVGSGSNVEFDFHDH